MTNPGPATVASRTPVDRDGGGRELLRDLARRPPLPPGELQRDVGRVVAVGRVARAVEGDGGARGGGERVRESLTGSANPDLPWGEELLEAVDLVCRADADEDVARGEHRVGRRRGDEEPSPRRSATIIAPVSSTPSVPIGRPAALPAASTVISSKRSSALPAEETMSR